MITKLKFSAFLETFRINSEIKLEDFKKIFFRVSDGMILRLASFRLSTRQISLSIGQKNPYRVLGVSVNASKKEVKKAYRSKVLDCHPGKFSCKKFLSIF